MPTEPCACDPRFFRCLLFLFRELFFMCVCRLKGAEAITLQTEELAAARWMPLEEFAALPYYTNPPGVRTVYAELNGAALAVARGARRGLRCLRLPVAPPDKPWRGENTIYVPAAKL